tara:strand:- start:261 stop:389 length:129 start_codon:yes stop_codon:yes gene_type:complete
MRLVVSILAAQMVAVVMIVRLENAVLAVVETDAVMTQIIAAK